MKIFYRVSDAGYSFKQKPEYVTKTNCLRNFVKNFGDDGLNLIFDNCKNETITNCIEIAPNAKVVGTSLGNAGSFLYALDMALQLSDDEVVLFQEDDYIHRSGSRRALLEGIEIADFVTLYDHPDKLLEQNLRPEFILRSNATHWRTCTSTTMTWAAKVETLRKSEAIVRKWCSGRHPDDHRMFTDLGEQGYTLISALPSFATHGESDWMAPLIDWERVMTESI